MGTSPRNLDEFLYGKQLNQELRSVIDTYFEDSVKYNRFLNVSKGEKLRPDDHKTIILGLAMRMTEKEILVMVNKSRRENGLIDADIQNLSYYRKKYGEIIDEVYIEATLRIGEIYSTADKMVRVARLHELAEVFRESVMEDAQGQGINTLTNQKANTYIRILDRMNVEVGAMPLAKMINRPNNKPNENNEPIDSKLENAEIAELVKSAISERYEHLLPSAIEQKLDFTDYKNCANGEKLGEIIVCWHTVMTNNNKGSQCPIQAGTLQKCPKFLNKSLLNDENWLKRQRENKQTIADIATIIGCEEFDPEVREVIAFHLKKYELLKAEKQESVEEN